MKAYGHRAGICLPIFILVVASVLAPSGAFSAQKDRGEVIPATGQPNGGGKGVNEGGEIFIKDAVARFGDRRAASQAIALQGWNSIREARVELAQRRFNEARLLDPKNYLAYWGQGALLSEQGKVPEAIEQLEIARELMGDSDERVSLLADMGALYSQYAANLPPDAELERARAFVAANQRFTESLEINSDYARSWREWAVSLYHEERFSEAWIKAQRAIELKAEPFPVNFLDRLREKHSNNE